MPHTHSSNDTDGPRLRVVAPDYLETAMLEYDRGADDRVPFTQAEADAMAADPCRYGYHRFTQTAAERAADDPEFPYDGLCCLRGCGYGIG